MEALPPSAWRSLLFLGAVAYGLYARWARRRFDPSAPLCGRPEWTMTRALRRGATYAQDAVLGRLAAPMMTHAAAPMHATAP